MATALAAVAFTACNNNNGNKATDAPDKAVPWKHDGQQYAPNERCGAYGNDGKRYDEYGNECLLTGKKCPCK